MTYSELARDIGKSATLSIRIGDDTLRLAVVVVDCRVVFGRTDYQVKYDNQLVWTNSANVRMED